MVETRQAISVLGIAALITAMGLAVIFAAELFLLVFGAIILAVFVRALSDFLADKTRLSSRVSFGFVTAALLGLISLGGWLLTPLVVEQFEDLVRRLPTLFERLEDLMGRIPGGGRIFREMQELGDGGEQALSGIIEALSFSLRGLVRILVVLVTGFYLAAEPNLYTGGFLRLFPISRRDRAREILTVLGWTLRRFLLGRVVSMIGVGLMTWIGLALIGVPAPALLGLIAGTLTFVPYAGPIAASIPIGLAALLESPATLAYAMVYYTVVQSIEGFIITPLVQEKAVMLPPALTLAAEVFMGLLFGAIGVILSVPAAALAVPLVRMVYVEDFLGDRRSDDSSDLRHSG